MWRRNRFITHPISSRTPIFATRPDLRQLIGRDGHLDQSVGSVALGMAALEAFLSVQWEQWFSRDWKPDSNLKPPNVNPIIEIYNENKCDQPQENAPAGGSAKVIDDVM